MTMCLSGWGQPHDALATLAPNAIHVDYARHNSVPDALAEIAETGKGHEVIIGWSLGGQLAVRAIAAGMLRPRALVLIGTPYQFVATPERALGMKRDLFEKFRDNYARNPERTLHKSGELIVKGDARADVRNHLQHDKQEVVQRNWLHWLHMLDGFTCHDLHLADFPPTLLVHGDNDAVVGAEQVDYFARAIPHARTAIWKDCGHAPHWHDAQKLNEWIASHV